MKKFALALAAGLALAAPAHADDPELDSARYYANLARGRANDAAAPLADARALAAAKVEQFNLYVAANQDVMTPQEYQAAFAALTSASAKVVAGDCAANDGDGDYGSAETDYASGAQFEADQDPANAAAAYAAAAGGYSDAGADYLAAKARFDEAVAVIDAAEPCGGGLADDPWSDAEASQSFCETERGQAAADKGAFLTAYADLCQFVADNRASIPEDQLATYQAMLAAAAAEQATASDAIAEGADPAYQTALRLMAEGEQLANAGKVEEADAKFERASGYFEDAAYWYGVADGCYLAGTEHLTGGA